ncbi:MAG TPA: hypothetical protein VG405_05495 [Solirubrobacteraceae bacterium]|jgi:hypothetical protein|nr:hypothetical protein [Solirubrobacteraceae bacterium]
MRRARLLALLFSPLAWLLGLAPNAPALTHSGQGIYGETSDVTITTAMFIVIAIFPAVIVVFSLLQSWLDHRKHARMDAAKRRAISADWRGGW